MAAPSPPPLDPDDAAEAAALARVAHALRSYAPAARWEVARWRRSYAGMSERHKSVLAHLPAKFDAADAAIDANAAFLTAIAAAALDGGGAGALAPAAAAAAALLAAEGTTPPPTDIDKVRYVLKNAARDWSDEGAPERAACYGRAVAALKAALPPPADPVHAPLSTRPRVLVPGCGLARLVVDVAAEGYACQGNEFSYFMLLASAYILNHAAAAEEGAPPAIIHPYVLTASNVAADADQLRGLAVPSPPPATLLPAPGLLSMVAGDFCEVYARRDAAASFDGVVTAFFIDTVPNVAAAIDVVAHVLRRGGVWINAGPLLYHWADAHAYLDDAPASVEVCLEDVLKLVAAAGFDIIKQSTADAPFNADPRSMARHGYRVAEWTAVKRGG